MKLLDYAHYVRDEEKRQSITAEAENLTTVNDLFEWARNHPSPVVGELIVQPLRFFMEEKRREDGKPDRDHQKLRIQLGQKYLLTLEHPLTPDICQALANWILDARYGRDIGTSYVDASLTVSCGESQPRETVLQLLTFIRERLQTAASS